MGSPSNDDEIFTFPRMETGSSFSYICQYLYGLFSFSSHVLFFFFQMALKQNDVNPTRTGHKCFKWLLDSINHYFKSALHNVGNRILWEVEIENGTNLLNYELRKKLSH